MEYIIVCPYCKSDDVQLDDSGTETILFCEKCCDEDTVIPLSRKNLFEYIKQI